MTFEQYDRRRQLPEGLLEQALALLEQAFPQEERRDAPEQRALMRSGEVRVLLALDEEGRLSALMTLWALQCGLFLEHFAVSPALRNQGLGGRMLEELKRLQPGRLILEAELPEGDWARRRLDFYARHGLTAEAGFPYVQPPYRTGGKEVSMHLLACPAFSSRGEFDAAAAEIHRTVYKVMR